MNKKNKKKSIKNYYIYIIISLPFVLLLFKNLFFNKFESNIFVLSNPSDYRIEVDAKSIVIKDEFLYYLGNFDFEVTEQKIGADVKLGDIDTSNIDENVTGFLSDSVSKLEQDLKKYENKKSFKFNFDELGNYIRSRDMKKAFEFVENNRTNLITEDNIKDRLFRYNILKDTINNKNVTSKNSGYVSTKVDGLESTYNFSVIDLIDEMDFNFTSNLEKTEISGIKVVNNLKYYLCIQVDKDSYKGAKTIDVLLGDKEVVGYIKSIKSGNDKDLIIAEFSSNFEYIKDKRYIDLKIVKNYKNAYKLPVTSVTYDDNGESYIHILNASNEIERIKVDVIHVDNPNKLVYISSKDLFLNPFASVIKDATDLKKVNNGEK